MLSGGSEAQKQERCNQGMIPRAPKKRKGELARDSREPASARLTARHSRLPKVILQKNRNVFSNTLPLFLSATATTSKELHRTGKCIKILKMDRRVERRLVLFSFHSLSPHRTTYTRALHCTEHTYLHSSLEKGRTWLERTHSLILLLDHLDP